MKNRAQYDRPQGRVVKNRAQYDRPQGRVVNTKHCTTARKAAL